jgi:hypothetical protein
LGQVAGTEIRNAEIDSFTVNKPLFWLWPFDQATFTTTLSNKGNVEFLPNGDVFTHKGDITKDLWHQAFNPDSLVILPDNARSYPVSWQPQTGFFKSDRNGLTINLDYFRFGKYYATAKIGYDINNKRVVEDRVVSFWIIPLPLIASLVALMLLGWIVRAVSRKLAKKKAE